MIGGASRDLLLNRPFTDYDFCTDATPEQMKAFLPENASYAFARFGSVRINEKPYEIDITTLREEGGYEDFRHPSKIKFIAETRTDCFRRDFTINAIYIAENGDKLDYVGGIFDLNRRRIRFIGDPYERIRQDPLRILRAERFAHKLGFHIEKKSQQAINELRPLLEKLNPEKVKMELLKDSN